MIWLEVAGMSENCIRNWDRDWGNHQHLSTMVDTADKLWEVGI